MKIALIILGAIICILLIALFLPLTVDLVYDRELIFQIKYSGITIFDSEKRVIIKKKKKAKKGVKDNAIPKKESFIAKTYRQKGLSGTISYFSNIIALLFKKLLWVAKRFKFRRFKFDLTVSTPDAANTAIQYGKICAAVYPTISLLQSVANFKPKEVNISADFDKTKSKFETSIQVTTRVFYWLVAAICILVQFLKLQRKEREKYERKQP